MAWLRLLIFLTIVALMVAQGMQIPVGALRPSLRRPGRLARAFLAIAVLVPISSWIVIVLVRPARPVIGAIALMAAAPLAPFTFPKMIKDPAGRDLAAFHLLLAAATVVITPAVLAIFGALFHFRAQIAFWPLARLVLITQLVPVAAGFAVRARWPSFAAKASRALTLVASAVFLAVVVLLVIVGIRPLLALGWRAVLAILLVGALSLAGGHLLAWDRGTPRTLLATDSAVRNPALAMLLARVLFPRTPAAPILVPYLILIGLVTLGYGAARRRSARRHPPMLRRPLEA